MEIVINYKGKKIKLDVKRTNYLTKFSGLMFRTRNTRNFIFEFSEEKNWSIHSCFVFFPFLAIWLDKQNNVQEYKIVNPFNLSVKPEEKFKRLVEVPINKRNKEILSFFVGKSGKV